MIESQITSLIIDDDPFSIHLLSDKIDAFVPDVIVVGSASSGQQGLKIIEELEPDIVFLGVEMTDMTGFEMLTRIKDINFQIIFITSFSHYAIKAIKFNALDYLIKPIDLGELKGSISRYKQRLADGIIHPNIHHAIHNFNTAEVGDQKLILHTQEGELRLFIKQIVRLEGDRNYSNILMSDGSKKLVSKTLRELEELLDGKGFFRCHKSHLINTSHISEKLNSTSILMSDNKTIPIARRKKKEFENQIQNADF